MSFSWQETFFDLSISFKRMSENRNHWLHGRSVFKGRYQPCLWTSVSVMSARDAEAVGWWWLKICAEGHCWSHFSLALSIDDDTSTNDLHEDKQVHEGNRWQRKGEETQLRWSSGWSPQADSNGRCAWRPAVWESRSSCFHVTDFLGLLSLILKDRWSQDSLDDVAAAFTGFNFKTRHGK